MAKKLNYADMAAAIITQLGTQENLTNVNHCATRLRVVVRDPSKVDAAALKKIDGVLGVEVRENRFRSSSGRSSRICFSKWKNASGSPAPGERRSRRKKSLSQSSPISCS